jgi:hypothetical protein
MRAYLLRPDPALLLDASLCLRKVGRGGGDPGGATKYVQSLGEKGYCWPDRPSDTWFRLWRMGVRFLVPTCSPSAPRPAAVPNAGADAEQ